MSTSQATTRQVMPAHSEEVERYTPAHIFEGLHTTFDLDPCAPADPDIPARIWTDYAYSIQRGEDGLTLPWWVPSSDWSGRNNKKAFVFVNPPWTRGQKRKWLMKLKDHGNGIALVRGGVDSAWLHDARPDALFLIRGRVAYLRPDGEPERPRKGGAKGGFEPSMLLAFGGLAEAVLAGCTLDGMYFRR